MKIAVSATGYDISSQINPRFGRCEYFIVVETDDMSFDAYENENNELSSGAGIQSASFVASKGVPIVLTGNCGPKASQTFSAAGIDVLTGYSGTVKQAIEQFQINGNVDRNPLEENLNKANFSKENPIKQTGRGMQMGGGGMGMGGGRCMGGSGRGMGMGGGGKMGMGIPQTGTITSASPISGSKEDELLALKEQAEQLQKQMETITKKINELE